MRNVFLIGSGRLSRLRQPLAETTNVTTTRDIFAEKSNVVSKIIKLDGYLANNDYVVIGDQLNSKSLLAAELAKRHDLPFLIRPRGTVIGEFGDRRRELPYWHRYTAVAKMRVIRNLVFAKSDGIIPVSHFVKNLIISSNLASPADIEVVHVPFDSKLSKSGELFAFKQQLGMNRNDTLLTSITGFSYGKKYGGIIDYSETIDRTLGKYENVHYAVVGKAKYPAGNKEKIERSAVREIRKQFSSENQSRLHFPGYVSNIGNLYTDTDIFLHLSYRDSLGTVVMEAESFALPVVVNTGGGMREMLPNSGCSPDQVVQTNDELEKKLQRLVEDRKLREDFGRENSSWIKSRFDKKSIGEEFTTAINTFI